MEKMFDREIAKLPKNQLLILRYMLGRPEVVVTTRGIARKTGVVEKQLGGVLSAMSRRRVGGMSLIEPMGRDEVSGLRWKLNIKSLTVVLAANQVRLLLASYR